jgi:hypothetical protein
MIPVTIFLSALFLYVLLSECLAQTPITAPIIFTTVGMVTFPAWACIARSGMTATIFLRIAEIGMINEAEDNSSCDPRYAVRQLAAIFIHD